jgi:hypothetical protein
MARSTLGRRREGDENNAARRESGEDMEAEVSKRRSYADLFERLRALAALPGVDLQTIGEFEAEGRTYPMFLITGCLGVRR